MLIVKLKGGLGNQMFQYAFGRALSLRRNEPLKLDVSSFPDHNNRTYCLDKFDIKAEIATPEECCSAKFKRPSMYKRFLYMLFRRPYPLLEVADGYKKEENVFEYSCEAGGTKYHYYEGYWQNERYFQDIRSDLISTFSPENSHMKVFGEYLKMILLSRNAVGVHVRRGDYVDCPATNRIYGLLDVDYYYKAIQYQQQKFNKPDIFVFSDDISWCKSKIRGEMIFIESTADYEDIYLMSQCKHHIIANSSFSWWAAWLCQNPDKTVIAPKRWFADDELNKKASKIINEKWICM